MFPGPYKIKTLKKDVKKARELFGTEPPTIEANLSLAAWNYLSHCLGIIYPDADAENTGLIWMHALAVGYAPAYLRENAKQADNDLTNSSAHHLFCYVYIADIANPITAVMYFEASLQAFKSLLDALLIFSLNRISPGSPRPYLDIKFFLINLIIS